MTSSAFEVVLDKIRPFTDYIYLHVLGEPLLHPQFEDFLKLASMRHLHVNITTNGSLIHKQADALMRYPVRQINISLHDAQENIPSNRWTDYLQSVFFFAHQVSPSTYVNFRLWNSGVATSVQFNALCMEAIASEFKKEKETLCKVAKDSGVKLAEHIFLQTAPRFEWPDGDKTRSDTTKTCYALRDQVAILTDGSIVPCCLDADGAMTLGNIFQDDLLEVLQRERAQKIKKGFENHTITEDFCRSCGFFITK